MLVGGFPIVRQHQKGEDWSCLQQGRPDRPSQDGNILVFRRELNQGTPSPWLVKGVASGAEGCSLGVCAREGVIGRLPCYGRGEVLVGDVEGVLTEGQDGGGETELPGVSCGFHRRERRTLKVCMQGRDELRRLLVHSDELVQEGAWQVM